jgi:hypothetical protein
MQLSAASLSDAVAMELDTIITDPPALEALINTRISARKQQMEKMISQLSNQVNATLFPMPIQRKRDTKKQWP